MVPEWPRGWLLQSIESSTAAVIDYRGKSPRKAPSGIPLVTAKIVKDGRILEPQEFIPHEDYERWMTRGLPELGDVVLTTEAPLGEVAQLGPGRVALAQRIIVLRGRRDSLDSTYLKLALRSDFVQEQLHARATGTTVMGISQASLRQVVLPVPPLEEQRAIARILGALENKIELNRQINRTLEAMAQALFKSWFVDFDPVTAKTAGRQPLGMIKTTANLFPDRFADSGEGPLPVGWRLGVLADIAGINVRQISDSSPSASIRYVDISSVSPGRIDSLAHYAWANAPSRARRLVRHGDTIWSCVRPNRRSYCFIRNPAHDTVVSTGFAVLTPRSGAGAFLYMSATTDEFVEYLTSHAEGSAYPAVRPDSFARGRVVHPSEPIVRAFEEMVDPLLELAWRNNEESRALTALRDTLLPKLLSGEIRVREAEKLVERAGA
ncbi:MAG: restriction endonuclease subunit S [Candidatus Rokubacteria bacterium]|nr:restriction endonuclease subunit S [Candidatus Rokubacteria bacterium]